MATGKGKKTEFPKPAAMPKTIYEVLNNFWF